MRHGIGNRLLDFAGGVLGGFILLNVVLLMFMSGREVASFDLWLGATTGKAIGLVPGTAQVVAAGVGDGKSYMDPVTPKPKSKVIQPKKKSQQ